jgi:hypothetical protein
VADDIPSLTLRVLEKIQTELGGLRGDVQTLRGEVQLLRGDVQTLRGDVQTLNERFDHFLT